MMLAWLSGATFGGRSLSSCVWPLRSGLRCGRRAAATSRPRRKKRTAVLQRKAQASVAPAPDEHVPVLLEDVVNVFADRPLGVFLDGTVGAGGHAEALLERCDIHRYIGIDQDQKALHIASQRLQRFGDVVELVHGNYEAFPSLLSSRGVHSIDGMLLDIGVSSMQLGDAERGFSFLRNGPLDMRMDCSRGVSASEVVNSSSEEELSTIFWELGEERRSRHMARRIVTAREQHRIETTYDLVAAACGAAFADGKRPAGPPRKNHPATLIFQALRIHVNRELDVLQRALPDAVQMLTSGSGRLAVITFHSLEDRRVKRCFRHAATLKGGVEDLTRRPIIASAAEIARNSRSRSAKLRAVQRLHDGQAPVGRRNKYARDEDPADDDAD